MSWKAKIIDEGFTGCEQLVLYIENYAQPGTVSVMMSDGDTMKTIGIMDQISDCTLRLPRGASQAILQAILERGVKPQEQSKVEGLLEATKVHLEDMRRLVFKGSKP
jgi:hypothetical protein